MQANTKMQGGWRVIYLPRYAQIGPELKKLLDQAGFVKTGSEFQQHFRFEPRDVEESTRAERAALHICKCYNSGDKEYTRELLHR